MDVAGVSSRVPNVAMCQEIRSPPALPPHPTGFQCARVRISTGMAGMADLSPLCSGCIRGVSGKNGGGGMRIRKRLV